MKLWAWHCTMLRGEERPAATIYASSSTPCLGRRWAAFLVGMAWLVAGLARAEVSPEQSLSLRDAIQSALWHNRALQIERINPEIARLTLSASYGFYDPLLVSQVRRENVSDSGAFDPANPAVDTGFDSKSDVATVGLTGFLPTGLTYDLNGNYGHSSGSRDFLNFDSYRVTAGVFLQQPLLKNSWIDLPRLTIRVNKSNLKISQEGVRFVAMDVINLVQQGYCDLVYAWENLRIQQELLTTRTQFHGAVQRQIELGKLTVLEERVAISQQAKSQTDLITASNTLALAGNNLRTLMGVVGSNWTEHLLVPMERLVVVGDAVELNVSWQRGLAQRPDLLQLAKGVENAASNLRFRHNQLFPSLDVMGSYGRRGASSVQAFPPDKPTASSGDAFSQVGRGDSPSDMLGLVLTMPLSRTAERANYRAGKQLKQQAELLLKQKEEQILREVSDAIHGVRFNFERVRSARNATEYARGALRAEEEKLTGGKSSIIFVLQLQADLAASQTIEAQAGQDYHKALSQLHFAEGTILERNKIELEFR